MFLNTGYNHYGTAKWVKTQLHCHSREPATLSNFWKDHWNGFGGPGKLLSAYRDFGYGAVAITDHHGKNAAANPVLKDPRTSGVTFIRGLEDSEDVHMVVLGCGGASGFIMSMRSLDGRMREYKEKGGVLIAAHPLNPDMRWTTEHLTDGRLAVVE